MIEEKEQLEKELKFLEESLQSNIITKEEYEKRKEEIEKKLNNLETETKEVKEEMSETQGVFRGKPLTSKKISDKPDKEESSKKEEIKVQEIKGEKLKEIEEEKTEEKKAEEKEQEEVKEEEMSETLRVSEHAQKSSKKISDKKEIEEEKAEEKQKELKEEETTTKQVKKSGKKKKNKLVIFSVIILIILFLIFFFNPFKGTDKEKSGIAKEDIVELKPVCISDNDCKEEGKKGICLNPNTTGAECEFREDKIVSLTILSDKNCVSCDSTRMFQVIKKLFPFVEKTEIDYNSEEGKQLVEQFNIISLPAYIFESDIEEATNFDKFKRALIKKEGKFIINPAASGSSYYFKRNHIKNKLDFFVLNSTQPDAENNLNKVVDLFEDKIDYSKKTISDEKEKNKLYKELGITTYPSFLVNNQLKFTGILSPEAIKDKFCELNELAGCETKLSEDIK